MSSVVILIQITEDRKKGVIKTRGYIDARDMNIQDQYQTIIISTFKLDIAVAWHIYTEHLKSHSISVYYTAKVSKLKRLIIV